jgi:hypothetical protein
MDDRLAVGVDDDSDLERGSVTTRADEHRHVTVIGCDCSPVMSVRMQHVVVSDTVLAGACLDIQESG